MHDALHCRFQIVLRSLHGKEVNGGLKQPARLTQAAVTFDIRAPSYVNINIQQLPRFVPGVHPSSHWTGSRHISLEVRLWIPIVCA